jgi:hypothetical protein
MLRLTRAFVLLVVLVPAAGFAHYGARYEPADGKIYHGCGWDGYSSQARYNEMFPADHHPLILQVVADVPGYRGYTVDRVVQSLTRLIVHPDSQYVEYGVHLRDSTGTMLDSVFAFTTDFDRYVDTLATALQIVDRPFFLRIGFEFNGYWNPYHPHIYPLAFRKLVSELHARGVTQFATVWCFEPDADADFADSSAQGWKWYPGDDVVDWFGLDPFDMEHFNPDLPDSSRGEITPKGRSEAFLRFARERGKPVYLNELSARNVFMIRDSLDPQGDSGRADFDYWFTPFFRFVRNHPEIKGWNYINLDWTKYETYKTWGDARLEINTEIRTRWVDTLMQDRFINAGYDITTQIGIEENEPPRPRRLPAIIARGVLFLQASPFILHSSLFDMTGRKVMPLKSGRNDLSRLARGIYFVREAQEQAQAQAQAIAKFVITR